MRRLMDGRFLALPLVFLTTITLIAQNDAPTRLQRYLQKGNQALKSGDWVEAEKQYRAALQLDAELFEVHSNLGLSCYFQQKYEQAEEAFLAALRINSNVFVPNFFLGIIYHGRGEFSKTLPLLTKATQLQPEDAEAHYWLGLNLANSGDYEAAAKEMALAIDRGSGTVDAFYHLGKTYAKLAQHAVEKAVSIPVDGTLYHQLVLAKRAQLAGNWSLARRYYEAARRQNGAVREIALELGQVALASSEWVSATTEFQAELVLDPQSYQSHFGLAQAYLNLQEMEKALFHLRQALNIRPEFFQPIPSVVIDLPEDKSLQLQEKVLREYSRYGGEAALLSIWLAEQLKNPVLSQSSLREFERQRKILTDRFTSVPLPGQATQLKQTAESLLKNKRFEEAVRAYTSLQRLNAADHKIHLPLAEALSEIGKHKEASAALSHYLHFFPMDGHALFRLAQCYEKLSVEAFSQISKVDARSYRNHQLLAESLLERSDWGGAVKEFQSALAMEPNDSELYFGLGRAYLKAGRISDAAEQFQTALKLDPFDPSVTYSVGLCHYLRKEPDKAIHFLRKAVSQDPNLLAAREQLGRVLVMQGQHAEAVPELEASLPVDSDGSLHYLLYVCYRKLQKPEKAKAALEASEQIRTRNRELVESKVGEASRP
jgi:tetratricopeptide (TPR) repeat protein